MNKIIYVLLFWSAGLLSVFGAEPRLAANLDDVHAASCRVHASRQGSNTGAVGTGTVIALHDGRYWVLTNWHVIDGFNRFKLNFFRSGKIFEVQATLEKSWHDERAPWDFALLSVPKGELQAYDPPIVPLAAPGTKPVPETLILSSGCSEGRWSLAWKGTVENYYGETVQFYPAPKSGQSGSALVQDLPGGLAVTGILTWRVGDERSQPEEKMRGGGIPIAKLYEAAAGKRYTGKGDAVPPDAVWTVEKVPVKESQKEEKETGKASPVEKVRKGDPVAPATPNAIRVNPVIYQSEQTPAVSYQNLILLEFTAEWCSWCKKAKPIVEKLAGEGYDIRLVDTDSEEGKRDKSRFGVSALPTFILVRDHDGKAEELRRWSGTENLEQRIRAAFAAFAKTVKQAAPPADQKPVTTDEPKKETGDITGLLDSFRGNSGPSSGGNSGSEGDAALFGNRLDGVVASVDKNLSKLAESTEKRIDVSLTKLDKEAVTFREDLTNGTMQALRILGVLLAIFAVLSWFALKALGKLLAGLYTRFIDGLKEGMKKAAAEPKE